MLAAAASQLRAYFRGELTSFDLPLTLRGHAVPAAPYGQACRRIPYGETISYGELARRIGQPSASRAVGLANGRNPVSIVVPCHRVIGADGSLTGYGGGMDRKRFLLALEQRVSGQTLALTRLLAQRHDGPRTGHSGHALWPDVSFCRPRTLPWLLVP